jgi:hypothetical protein
VSAFGIDCSANTTKNNNISKIQQKNDEKYFGIKQNEINRNDLDVQARQLSCYSIRSNRRRKQQQD